ncbi:MAG: SDR family NAD(P)-dependent oxidoreductase, partial [Nitrosopumilus sp.]
MVKALVTGGAGFLGRGLLRQASVLGWDISVFSRDENKQDECRGQFPQARYILGDIRDTDHLSAIMVGHDIVIHGAAIKFVDRAELNATETVSVNVLGSLSVIQAARSAGVERVVGISTDKAVQPVNIYGATKMAMERLFAEASIEGRTTFNCVRYGNVIGSTGSVIPFFKRQADELGYVTITDPNMTRFWMGIDEAVHLIDLALTKALPGAVVIPEVRAMRMKDVVSAVVPKDTEVKVIGIRPGEKMHESLLHHEESVRVVWHRD